MAPLIRSFNRGEGTPHMDLCKTSACIAGRTYEASYHIDGDSLVAVSDLRIARGELGGLPDGIIAKMLLRDLIRRHVLEAG
jgi:hypothetical protein